MQKVYKTALKLLNTIFITIIDARYYFKCQQEEIDVILYKSSKDKTISKEHRIITHLNCLVKITKKITVTRIAYLVENSLYNIDILNNKQIRDKKQKSTIDVALNLVYNAQIVENRDNTLFCSSINVKEAFDYVSFIILINILKKLNILRNIIN